MKKFLILILLLLTGCTHELSISTISENNSNMKITLNYPKTGIKKLDNVIGEYVKSVYDGFKVEYENYYDLNDSKELNIDYRYFESDNYTNVILYTYVNTSKKINEIKTIIYDNNSNKIVKLSDIITKEELSRLVPIIKQDLIKKYKDCIILDLIDSEITDDFNNYNHFTVNKNTLEIYFEPYKITNQSCNIVNISVPLSNSYTSDVKETNHTFNYEPVNRIVDPSSKVVALTFDDGPSKYTKEIIDILNKNDVEATFFILGNKANIYSDTLKYMVSSGNEIGNHSYNHKWLTRLSNEELKEQIEKTQDIIFSITNTYPILLRPTYGSLNNKIRNNTDLTIVLWNVDSNDWKIKNYKTILNNVLRDTDDMDIILFHDTYKRTVKVINELVPKLKSEGYQFVTVSELYEIKKIRNAKN